MEVSLKVIEGASIKGDWNEGQKGRVLIANLVDEKNFLLGLREIEPGSLVPKKVHHHTLKQANYIISGSGTITNTKQTISFKAGDVILLDGNEEHYFETKTGIRMVEIRYR